MISKTILEKSSKDFDVIRKLWRFAMTNTKLWFGFGVAIMCLALSVNTAASQTLEWSPSQNYDDGGQTSVAVHPSGLVLEAHQTHLGDAMWYRLGTLNGASVTWGGSQRLPGVAAQNWPNVAITKEGYVIYVHSTNDFKRFGKLYYMVGKIDPNAGANQSITWLTDTSSSGTFIDAGFHSSMAVNKRGEIVLAFESGSGGNGLYYRMGHLQNPAGGNYSITWDSGRYGKHYDEGLNPHIALNNLDEVVEVHEVDGEPLLHCRRGIMLISGIRFGGSQRYDSNGSRPAVALLDSGLVVELHSSFRNDFTGVYARTGTLSPSNPEEIKWSDSVRISPQDLDGFDSAVASNGSYAIGTWLIAEFTADRGLYYSVAAIP